jgi:hypothetical protein
MMSRTPKIQIVYCLSEIDSSQEEVQRSATNWRVGDSVEELNRIQAIFDVASAEHIGRQGEVIWRERPQTLTDGTPQGHGVLGAGNVNGSKV